MIKLSLYILNIIISCSSSDGFSHSHWVCQVVQYQKPCRDDTLTAVWVSLPCVETRSAVVSMPLLASARILLTQQDSPLQKDTHIAHANRGTAHVLVYSEMLVHPIMWGRLGSSHLSRCLRKRHSVRPKCSHFYHVWDCGPTPLHQHSATAVWGISFTLIKAMTCPCWVDVGVGWGPSA